MAEARGEVCGETGEGRGGRGGGRRKRRMERRGKWERCAVRASMSCRMVRGDARAAAMVGAAGGMGRSHRGGSVRERERMRGESEAGGEIGSGEGIGFGWLEGMRGEKGVATMDLGRG